MILLVAVTTYANSGLRLAGHDTAANFLNIAVAGGAVLALIGLDKVIAPRFKWARGEWFRVCLVLIAGGFAFFGFTESFWETDFNGLSVLALGLMGVLIFYLYRFTPSLATLALACFGLFSLVAQFGFKLFEFGDWNVGTVLMVFLWLGALTVSLVAVFRHIIRRFKKTPGGTLGEDEAHAPAKASLASFTEHLKLDAARVSVVLTTELEHEQPWYMGVFIAFAGILTAIMGCFLFGLILALTGFFDNELSYGILGGVIFLVSIFIRRTAKSPYLKHILNTMIVIGGVMTAAWTWLPFQEF